MHAFVATVVIGCLMIAAPIAWPQDSSERVLKLGDALNLAKERNGVVKSAYLQIIAADSRLKQARADFWPTLKPTFRIDATASEQLTGAPNGSRRVSSTDDLFNIDAEWTLFDAGQRNWTFASRRYLYQAVRFDALQTLRETLFSVYKGYYEVLRTTSLLTVQRQQLARAQEILKQTQERINVKLEAAKNEKQALADVANAEVSVIGVQARRFTAIADLKALIDWREGDLPPLEDITIEILPALEYDLNEATKKAIANRADLIADRNSLEATRTEVKIAEINAGITWSIGTTARRSFSPDVLNRAGLSLQATVPLFDGERSREEIRSRRATYEAQSERLRQSERDVASDVESQYRNYEQSMLRLIAARRALEAAQVNYDAVSEARQLGAANLIDVITAQTSLVIAQSNSVEAQYDGLISIVALKLAIGDPLPGEADLVSTRGAK